MNYFKQGSSVSYVISIQRSHSRLHKKKLKTPYNVVKDDVKLEDNQSYVYVFLFVFFVCVYGHLHFVKIWSEVIVQWKKDRLEGHEKNGGSKKKGSSQKNMFIAIALFL